MESKNQEVLDSLRDFCLEHPELRFWQAVRAWTGQDFVLFADIGEGNGYENYRDTHYFENRIN